MNKCKHDPRHNKGTLIPIQEENYNYQCNVCKEKLHFCGNPYYCEICMDGKENTGFDSSLD